MRVREPFNGASHLVGLVLACAGTWTLLPQQLPDLTTSNMGGGALTFPEGQRVFIVGGSGTGSVITGRTLAFNPADGTFTTKAPWPPSPNMLPGGWAVYNNKLYVFGGLELSPALVGHDDIWVYDPTANSWSDTTAMTAARTGHTATLLADGRVLLAGGDNPSGLASAELYDPTSRTWSATGTMTAVHIRHVAVLLQDGRVLAARPTGELRIQHGSYRQIDPSYECGSGYEYVEHSVRECLLDERSLLRMEIGVMKANTVHHQATQ